MTRVCEVVLGVVSVKIETAAQAAGLLRRVQRSRSVTVLTAREVVIDADQPQVPVGIDGESVLMPTPVHCTIRPLSRDILWLRSRACGIEIWTGLYLRAWAEHGCSPLWADVYREDKYTQSFDSAAPAR